jgi:hypothetical protein
MCALTNPGISCGSNVVDDYLVVSYLVFDDDFRVKRDCVCKRMQASAGKQFW